MGSRKNRSKRISKPVRLWLRPAFWIVIGFAVVVAVVIARLSVPPQRSGQTSAGSMTEWDDSWPSLPRVRATGGSIDEIRAAYAFAAHRPDVVQYMPCYCGCQSQGHRSLHDCFIKGRTASGDPEWDGMGFT